MNLALTSTALAVPRAATTAPLKLLEFQVLRGLAAAAVVWGHAFDWAAAAGNTAVGSAGLRAVGAAGVDLFFIISGFIIVRTAFGDRRPGAAEFMVRRLLRIVPLYWCWSAVVYAWQTGAGNTVSSAQVAKTFTFLPWFETQGYVLPVLYLGWTLSYELAFYSLVGLVMAGGLRRPWVLVAITVALAAASLFARSTIAWVPFLANPLWLEFAAGIVLAGGYERLARLPRILGILTLAAGVGWWVAAVRFAPPALAEIGATLDNTLSWPRVFWWGGGALGIATGAAIVFGRDHGPRLPALPVALGDASYSWYLTQALTLPVAAMVWRSLVRIDSTLGFTLFAVAFSAGAALLLARALEFPLHRRATAWAKRRFRGAADRIPLP